MEDALRQRAVLVRNAFLVALALVHLVAFVSLASQLDWLIGSRGLLPADALLGRLRGQVHFWELPTIFWLSGSDAWLRSSAVVGAALALGLLLGVYPRALLLVLWLLYLSFVSVGQTFFAFQWDNLLLETTLLACTVAPWSRRGLSTTPHPAGVFLMRWLLVRLHVESGLAKLLSGDPSWRDLTALVTYYETAPLPTSLAWFVHQLPVPLHRFAAFTVLVVEILLPWGVWGPRRIRRWSVASLAILQVFILATANYGFFNYLTLALCLWGLDDEDLRRLRWCLGGSLSLPAGQRMEKLSSRCLRFVAWLGAIVWALVAVIPFFPFMPPLRNALPSLREWLAPWRAMNAYHLFASMTYVRYEAVIEGSDDGQRWQEYEFRYKPGDVRRAPPLVAPHQPRVDFQLWFLLLRGRAPRDQYFYNLLVRLLKDPQVVAGLFASDPFSGRAPRAVRVAVYRYRFTDWNMGWSTGAWWQRERVATFGPLDGERLAR